MENPVRKTISFEHDHWDALESIAKVIGLDASTLVRSTVLQVFKDEIQEYIDHNNN